MRNTNMRKGFTMIELIFVIVIIGILAAVAIPKLAGTAEEARKSTMNSFMGSLNRSVGPAMWAIAVTTTGGKVSGTGAAGSATAAFDITEYTEIPDGVTVTLTSCDENGTGAAGGVTTAVLPVAEVIYCKDGTGTSAPRFGFGPGSATEDVNASLQNN